LLVVSFHATGCLMENQNRLQMIDFGALLAAPWIIRICFDSST